MSTQYVGRHDYFTGKPCIRGHISPRSLCGHCKACSREYRAKRYVKRPRCIWPPERVNLLREMAPTKTAREIAQAIGVSRGAVIGKCYRANIPLEAWNAMRPAP